MKGKHTYNLTVQWTGNNGKGRSDYRSYERSHTVLVDNKKEISCSSDPSFRGDNTKHNPEELFVASIATCHMLWFLHLCADAGIIVLEYIDRAIGIMQETNDGGGHFTEVTLSPSVIVSDPMMIDKANDLHAKANQLCFIANSCNFPIHHHGTCMVKNA